MSIPLTDQQIDEILDRLADNSTLFHEFAREIERAHDILPPPEKIAVPREEFRGLLDAVFSGNQGEAILRANHLKAMLMPATKTK